ncbi:MAG: thioredoxin-dependent thiol peroxidase [Cyanobacteria bacterium P01_A01_bin.84]
MSNIPQPEEKAPSFTIDNQHGEPVSLKDFQGKWLVLYFYPKDNTPGCTTEAQDFSTYKQEFADLNTEILGVSTDSEESHRKFIDKRNLSINLLSDRNHEVADIYRVWRLKKFMGKEYMGIERSTFLIKPDQTIAHSWFKVRTKGHAEAVLNKLKDLKVDE